MLKTHSAGKDQETFDKKGNPNISLSADSLINFGFEGIKMGTRSPREEKMGNLQ